MGPADSGMGRSGVMCRREPARSGAEPEGSRWIGGSLVCGLCGDWSCEGGGFATVELGNRSDTAVVVGHRLWWIGPMMGWSV